MNPRIIPRLAVLSRAIGTSLATIALQVDSIAGAVEPKSPGVFVSIVFPAGASTDPVSDAPPQLIQFTSIELSPKLAASIKPGIRGGFRANVDEQGSVRDIEFADSPHSQSLAQPIRSAVMQWKFQPLRCQGEFKSAWVPLAYRVNVPATSADPAAQDVEPPIPIFRVEPSPVPALSRQPLNTKEPYSERLVKTEIERTTQLISDGQPGSMGRSRTVTRVVQRFGDAHVEFLDTPSPAAEPWWAASVTLEFEVDAGGIVQNLAVFQSSCPIMEPEAAAAIRSWRFRPSMKAGEPVRARIRDTLVVSVPKGVQPPNFIRRLDKNRTDARWDTAPQLTRLCLPVYPTELVHTKTKGKARAEIHLDETGQFLAIETTEATDDAFGLALRAALLDCRFEPAQKSGKPARAAFAIEARFTPEPEEMQPDEPRLPAVLLDYPSDAPLALTRTLDRAPKLLVGRQPTLDPRLCRYETNDTVLVEFIIDPSGRVKEPSVVSAPQPPLGYVAIQAVSSWLFEGPTSNGKPVATRARVPLTFSAPPATSEAPQPESVNSAASVSR